MRNIGQKKAGFDTWYKQTTIFGDLRYIGKLLQSPYVNDGGQLWNHTKIVDAIVFNDAFGYTH